MERMDQLDPSIADATRRMEIRGVVKLAGEVIAQYWPMRTFVHHNPLHGLERRTRDWAGAFRAP